MPLRETVRPYFREGTTFELTVDELNVARTNIPDFNSRISPATGATKRGILVTAKNAPELDELLTEGANLTKEN